MLIRWITDETSECYWVNYSVPKLIDEDVRRTLASLRDTIDQVFSESSVAAPGPGPGPSASTTTPVFDSSLHFFASTQLAHLFPGVMESAIVRRFHSTVPPVSFLNHTATRSTEEEEEQEATGTGFSCRVRGMAGEMWRGLRRFSIFLLLLSLLRALGAVPVRAQRVLIHTAQPIVVAGFYLAFTFLAAQPEYSLLPVAMVALLGLRYLLTRPAGAAMAGKAVGTGGPEDETARAAVVVDRDRSNSSSIKTNSGGSVDDQRAEAGSDESNWGGSQESRGASAVNSLHLPVAVRETPAGECSSGDDDEDDEGAVVDNICWESSSESDGLCLGSSDWPAICAHGWRDTDSEDWRGVSVGVGDGAAAQAGQGVTGESEDEDDEEKGKGKVKGVVVSETLWESSSESDGYPVWPGESGNEVPVKGAGWSAHLTAAEEEAEAEEE
jgi:hypothetical protein